MATLITRADGNFTDATTWGTAATGGSGANACLIDSEVASYSLAASTTIDSSTFQLPATDVDGLAIKINSIGSTFNSDLTIILRNSTTGTDQGSVSITAGTLNVTNMKGWLLVPFASFTPNGSDNYVVRLTRGSNAAGVLSIFALSGNNFSRIIRTTTTAAPASGDQLVMCGEYAGSTTVNLRTVTMDNTATTTFGAVVATYPQAISINDKATLDWANSASTNYYLRFKGIFRVQARGILQMYTATSGAGSLPSTSTAVLEMDCTAAGDSAIQIGGSTAAVTGGTWTLNGQIRGTSGSITGATNATPIEITDVAHGYETGAGVVISGITGNTAANGTWWITKTGTDTYTLDDSVGNGTYSAGGTRVSRLASKMQTVTDINTDTISMGSIVSTSTNTVTWREGTKFDTGWTGKVSINGIIYTISSVTNTTTIVLTISIGTLTGASFIKLGTGAPVTMNLADNSFLAVDDVLGTCGASGRVNDSNIALVSSVGSSGQITLKGPPCEYIVSVTNGSPTVKLSRGQVLVTSGWTTTAATIDGNSVTITSVGAADTLTLSANYAGTTNTLARLQITDTTKTQSCAYLSGLNNADGDVRSEVFLLNRNVMVRSMAAPGLTTGLYGLIQIGGTDAVVNWNYGEFSQLGSGSGVSSGINIEVTTGSININFCTIRDFWSTNSQIRSTNGNVNTLTFANNFCSSLNGAGGIGYTGQVFVSTPIFTGNIFHLCTTAVLISISPNSTFTFNTFVGCSLPIYCTLAGTFGSWYNNTLHSCNGVIRLIQSTINGNIGKMYIWRMATSLNFGIINASQSSATTSPCITLTDWTIFSVASMFLNTGPSNITMVRPIINSGPTHIYSATNLYQSQSSGGGVLIIYDGEIGQITALSTIAVLAGGFGQTIIAYNTLMSMTNSGVVNNIPLGNSFTSIKHNQVAGDNRVLVPFGGGGASGGSGGTASFTFLTDTTIYNRESPSMRCYVAFATPKIQTPVMYVPVKSGINPTISIKVRKSVVGDGTAYNGSEPRLILLANTALGYSYDTTLGYNMYSAVLATASGAAGAWETLTANLPTTPTEDGVVAVVVDMDGTAGWVNIDDFYVDSPNTSGTQFWHGDFAGPMQISGPEAAIVKRRRKPR